MIELARKTLALGGNFVEVGIDEGSSAVRLLELIKGTDKWLFTVDPHGDKPFTSGQTTQQLGYGEQTYRTAMLRLAACAVDNDSNHTHFRMTSERFMTTYDDTDIWAGGGKIDKSFCFVFLDGEHYTELVTKEFEWFAQRLVPRGIIVVDDFHMLVNPKELLAYGGTVSEVAGHKQYIWEKPTSSFHTTS